MRKYVLFTRSVLTTLALAFFLGGLAGCQSATTTLYEEVPTSNAPSAPIVKSLETRPGSTDSASSMATPDNLSRSSSAISSPFTLQPQLIKTANVTLKVDNLQKANTKLSDIVQATGGVTTNQYFSFIEDKSTYRNGNMTVRIPQNKLDSFLEQLVTVGKILTKQVTATDVGTEMVDTAARIRNLQAEEKALQHIMQRAGKISEVLEASRELARVRGAIEQVKSRLEYLQQNVAYSSVDITLSEKMVTSSTETQPGLGIMVDNSIKQSSSALYGFLLGLVDWLIRLLIFLLPVLFIIFGIVYLIFKGSRKLIGNTWQLRRARQHAKGLDSLSSNLDDPPSD